MNKIVRREYYAMDVVLVSPLCVSGGEHELTDADVMRDYEGTPFVPGTSLAGAFRNYLGKKKGEKSVFGYAKEKEGMMSSLYVSDMYFENVDGVKTSIRDGVRLGEDKIVLDGGKFDREIVESGARGTIFIEAILRQNDTMDSVYAMIEQWAAAIQKGEILFGGKKNRGFGRLKIHHFYTASFGTEQKEKWLAFMEDWRKAIKNEEYLTDNWKDTDLSAKYVHISVPLKLTGGISIRRYSTRPNEADYEHITCNGVPVVPGSSWNGVIRQDIKTLLRDMGCNNAAFLLHTWFGFVDEKGGKKNAKQSEVVIAEGVLENSVSIPMTRNKINRFSQATIDGALYSEISCFGGTTRLEISVKKDANKSYYALLGALILAIKDIQRGYVSVGGQTAIGRGIFAAEQEIIWSEEIAEEECMTALYAVME